jgi:hypothetical protein
MVEGTGKDDQTCRSDDGEICAAGDRLPDCRAAEPQQPPDQAMLLALELTARRAGSGIAADQLPGRWRLEAVWPRAGRRPQPLASALLRGLDACLEIGPAPATAAPWPPSLGPPGLAVANRVSLGALELRFDGHGWLQGRRPLLLFRFERLQLRLAGFSLLRLALPLALPPRLPFFALIALGEEPAGPWLAARGRGGGLALWRRRT